MKTNKRLLLGVCAGLLVGAAALTTASALAPKHPHSDLLLANAEALASNEGGVGACCKNGYKKWYGTTNIPTQRKEYFKDCSCNDKEGDDPQSCSC